MGGGDKYMAYCTQHLDNTLCQFRQHARTEQCRSARTEFTCIELSRSTCTEQRRSIEVLNWTTSLASLPSTIDSNYKIEHPVPTEGGREIRHSLVYLCLPKGYGGQTHFPSVALCVLGGKNTKLSILSLPKGDAKSDIALLTCAYRRGMADKANFSLRPLSSLWQEIQNKPNFPHFRHKNKHRQQNKPKMWHSRLWHSRPRLWSFNPSRRDILISFCQNKPIPVFLGSWVPGFLVIYAKQTHFPSVALCTPVPYGICGKKCKTNPIL